MVELGTCRRCGAEYAIGKLDESGPPHRLRHAPPLAERPVRLLIGEALAVGEDDEDEDLGIGLADEAVMAWLCPGCGALSEHEHFACSCGAARTPSASGSPVPRRARSSGAAWLVLDAPPATR